MVDLEDVVELVGVVEDQLLVRPEVVVEDLVEVRPKL